MRKTQTKNRRGRQRRYELDSFVPGWGPPANSSNHGNNFSSYTDDGKPACTSGRPLNAEVPDLIIFLVNFFICLRKARTSFYILFYESKGPSFHNSWNPPLLTAFFEKLWRHIVLIFFRFGLQKLQTGIAWSHMASLHY